MFRARAVLGSRCEISAADTELVLKDANGIRVTLAVADGATTLTDARDIALVGTGFPTEPEAQLAAALWREAVVLGFARAGIGADFRERRPGGPTLSDDFRALLAERFPGVTLHDDIGGISVFAAASEAIVMTFEASLMKGYNADQLTKLVRSAFEGGHDPSPRRWLSFDLYSTSFFLEFPDSRLMMLAMALETLIDQQERDAAALEVIEQLTAIVNQSDLLEAAKSSLAGSVRSLKRESVNAAGRRLAATLGDRKYMDKTPPQFFSYCYNLRSALAHGHVPRPSHDEVNVAAANLEQMVGDLIAGQFLDVTV
jgi:hypothetical protein